MSGKKIMPYRFIAVKYGADMLKRIALEGSPMELKDLNNMLWNEGYFQNGWRIKQFVVHHTDDPVFVVLLERPEKSDTVLETTK